MLRTVVTAVCVCIFDCAVAEPVPLSGKALSEMIGGAVVELNTPLGTKIPIRYGDDSRMTGSAGALAFYLGAATDAGRWWVSGDQLCQKWEKWFDGETQCLRIKKDGSQIHWASRDGKSGTGTVQVRVAQAPDVARTSPAPSFVVASAAVPRTAGKPAAGIPEPSKLGAPAPESPEQPTTPADTSEPKAVPRFSRPVVVLPKKVAPTAQQVAQAAPPEPKPKSDAKPAATPTPTVAAAPLASVAGSGVPRFMVVNVDAADVLNVREGPSADHDIVGTIPPSGRGVAMTGACRSQWCPVRHGVLTGWVNRAFLENEEIAVARARPRDNLHGRDNPEASRGCLTPAARDLLARIEARFGAMQLVSTCRPGALIAGTGRLSRHSSGNAIDFNAGARKQAVVDWLVANHHTGGTMTYRDMDHIHVDIGPHFVALGAGSGARHSRYVRYAQSGRRD